MSLLLFRVSCVTVVFVSLAFSNADAQQPPPVKRPNVLLIVADDMHWNSPGCFGGTVEAVTPSIDRLADEGMRFWHAHVNVAVCTPSRSVMLTGLYPQHSGAEGFQRIRPGTPTLPAILNQAGYLTGTIGKPLGQQELFRWSVSYRWQGAGDENRWGRDPATYRRFTRSFLEMAKTSGQPFFLMASSHDPHRPFGGGAVARGRPGKAHDERAKPSRIYQPTEVTVPGFLPDIPDVRREVAEYFSSVRRFDDTVGAILDELHKSGFDNNTIVVFLSDHGMPFPFAKTNCYPQSTRTPLIVRWPGQVKPGEVDREHMVSGIDLLPTILEAVKVPANRWTTSYGGAAPPQLRKTPFDGRSFLPILQGQKQAGRDCVFTQFNHIHGRQPYPMRCVLTKHAAYIFNPWSNGSRTYRAEPLSGRSYRAMKQAGGKDDTIAARVRHLEQRTVEELYDRKTDPDCLKNRVGSADYQQHLSELRSRLRAWLAETKDSTLPAFDRRNDAAALEQFMQRYLERAQRQMQQRRIYEEANGYRF
ncbi:MAG: sulfatase [Planctomycetota bacterium]|nr:sulfatase [Planctomycetota bacterium]